MMSRWCHSTMWVWHGQQLIGVQIYSIHDGCTHLLLFSLKLQILLSDFDTLFNGGEGRMQKSNNMYQTALLSRRD